MAVVDVPRPEFDPPVLECAFCHLDAVSRQDDGTYICRACHGIQDIRDTYHEVDSVEPLSLAVRSYRIRQTDSEDERLNFVVLSEALQLILAFQTVSVEARLGLSISDSVFRYLTQFQSLLRPPFKHETFTLLPLLVLSGVVERGIPMTHIDLVRWIRDGLIPFTNPLEFLPQSFCERLTKREAAALCPDITNLNHLITNSTGHRITHKLHPLPNPQLVLWRIAAFLGVPERAFVAFSVALAQTPPLTSVRRMSSVVNGHGPELCTIPKFMKVGYSLPIALALFALSLIYRLDGTNWIHPSFAKLGFPEFPVVLQGILMRAEIAPVFPVISGPIPPLHEDIGRLLEGRAGPSVEMHAIVGDGREGFGHEATLPYDLDSLAAVNPDLRALLAGLSREFGIREITIMQQFVALTEKRLGNNAVTKRARLGKERFERYYAQPTEE